MGGVVFHLRLGKWMIPTVDFKNERNFNVPQLALGCANVSVQAAPMNLTTTSYEDNTLRPHFALSSTSFCTTSLCRGCTLPTRRHIACVKSSRSYTSTCPSQLAQKSSQGSNTNSPAHLLQPNNIEVFSRSHLHAEHGGADSIASLPPESQSPPFLQNLLWRSNLLL